MKYLFVFIVALFCSYTVKAQSPPPSAAAVMQQAYTRAIKENKNVFLIFHASWCGWCHKMDTAMQDKAIRHFFDDNYVITHITVLESGNKKVLENKGGNEMLAQYAGQDSGIPFWMIFDVKGKLLADALMRPDGAGLEVKGNNSGCPASKEEVAHFIKVLKQTSPLKDNELLLIEKRFRQNEN